MLILCLILIIFLPPSLFNCDHKKKTVRQSSRATINIGNGSRESTRDSLSNSTLKDSRRGKKKKKLGKVGAGARTRSINIAMQDDLIASPSPLKTVFISSSNHPTPKKEKLGEKELAILHGARCRNTDYPTMADIESDWDDKVDGDPRGVRTAEENNEQTAFSGTRTRPSDRTDKE